MITISCERREKYLYGIRWIRYIIMKPAIRNMAWRNTKYVGLLPGFL